MAKYEMKAGVAHRKQSWHLRLWRLAWRLAGGVMANVWLALGLMRGYSICVIIK